MNVRVIDLKVLGMPQAPLVALESSRNVPFEIKRIYYLFGTAAGVSRGFHAHKKLQQLMICVRGACKVLLQDGKEEMEILLNKPNMGLYIGAMIWREIHDLSQDCVVVVLADQYYDEDDYIRAHERFLEMTGHKAVRVRQKD
jgi:dTDP-4-dehydrorhamnose 3,5-epimerase-like enzyme